MHFISNTQSHVATDEREYHFENELLHPHIKELYNGKFSDKYSHNSFTVY